VVTPADSSESVNQIVIPDIGERLFRAEFSLISGVPGNDFLKHIKKVELCEPRTIIIRWEITTPRRLSV
jgi:hypothetical protein